MRRPRGRYLGGHARPSPLAIPCSVARRPGRAGRGLRRLPLPRRPPGWRAAGRRHPAGKPRAAAARRWSGRRQATAGSPAQRRAASVPASAHRHLLLRGAGLRRREVDRLALGLLEGDRSAGALGACSPGILLRWVVDRFGPRRVMASAGAGRGPGPRALPACSPGDARPGRGRHRRHYARLFPGGQVAGPPGPCPGEAGGACRRSTAGGAGGSRRLVTRTATLPPGAGALGED